MAPPQSPLRKNASSNAEEIVLPSSSLRFTYKRPASHEGGRQDCFEGSHDTDEVEEGDQKSEDNEPQARAAADHEASVVPGKNMLRGVKQQGVGEKVKGPAVANPRGNTRHKALKMGAGAVDLAARANAKHVSSSFRAPEEYGKELPGEKRETGRKRQLEFAREANGARAEEKLPEEKRDGNLSLHVMKTNGKGASGRGERTEGQGRKKGVGHDTSGHHKVVQRGDKAERKDKEEAQADRLRPEKPRKKKDKEHGVEVNGERIQVEVRIQGGQEDTFLHYDKGHMGDEVGKKGHEDAQAGGERGEMPRKKKDRDYGMETNDARTGRGGAAGTSEGGEGPEGQGRKKGGEEVTPVHQKHSLREGKGGTKEEGYVEGESIGKGWKKQERKRGVAEQDIEAKDEGEVSKEIQREDNEDAGAVGKTHKRGKKTKVEKEKVETEEHAKIEKRGGENGNKVQKRKKKEGKLKKLEVKDGVEKTEIDEENEEEQAKDGEEIETKEEEKEVDVEKLRIETKRKQKRLRREVRERRKLEVMNGVDKVETKEMEVDAEKLRIESKREEKRSRREEREWRKLEAMKEVEKLETEEEEDVVAEKLRIERKKERKRMRREERERRKLEAMKVVEKVHGRAEFDIGGTDTGEPKPKKRKSKAKKNISNSQGGKVEEVEKMEEENEGEEMEQGEEDEVCVVGMENKEVEKKVEGGVAEERRKERARSEAGLSKAVEPEVMRGKVQKGKEERGRKKEKCVEKCVDQEERMKQAQCEAGPSDKTPFANTTTSSLECFQGFVIGDQGQIPSAFLYQIRLPVGCGDVKPLLTSGPGPILLSCHSCNAVAFELHSFSIVSNGMCSKGHPPPSIPLATLLAGRPASAVKNSGEGSLRVHMDQSDLPADLTLDVDVSVDKENANERRNEKVEKTPGDIKENKTQLNEEERAFAEGTKTKSENVKEKKQRRKKKKIPGGENGNKTEAGRDLALMHEISATATAGSLGCDGVDLDMDMKVEGVEGQTRMDTREITNRDGGLDSVGQVAKSDKSKTREKKERLAASELLPSPVPLVDVKLPENHDTSKKTPLSRTNNEGVGASLDREAMTVVGVPGGKSVVEAERPEGSKEGEEVPCLSFVDGKLDKVDKQEGEEVICLVTGGGETTVVADGEVVEHGRPMDGKSDVEGEEDKEDGDGHVDGDDLHDDDPLRKRVGEQEGGEVNGGFMTGSDGRVLGEAPIIDGGLAVGGEKMVTDELGEVVVPEQHETPVGQQAQQTRERATTGSPNAAPRPRARPGAAPSREIRISPPPEVRCEMSKKYGDKIWHCKNLKVEGHRFCEQHIVLRTMQAERRRAKRSAAKALMQQGEGGAGSDGEAPEGVEGDK